MGGRKGKIYQTNKTNTCTYYNFNDHKNVMVETKCMININYSKRVCIKTKLTIKAQQVILITIECSSTIHLAHDQPHVKIKSNHFKRMRELFKLYPI